MIAWELAMLIVVAVAILAYLLGRTLGIRLGRIEERRMSADLRERLRRALAHREFMEDLPAGTLTSKVADA